MDSTNESAAKHRGRRTLAVVEWLKPQHIQPLPRWASPLEASQGAPSFLSAEARAGAALFALDQLLRADPAWLGCLRMRLALQAAVASSRLLKFPADEAALRDAEWLTRSGDDPGPAGRLHRLWRRFARQPTRLAEQVIAELAGEIDANDNGGEGAREVISLMQADAALAVTLGWVQPLPLAGTVIADPCWREGRDRRPFRAGGAGWEARRLAVMGLAATRAQAIGVLLSRRADAVATAADRLRTRDGGAGVRLILGDDCVAPWRMASVGEVSVGRTGEARGVSLKGREQREGLGSDRAARRLCESLHASGALRLLTERPTFRLYGL